jgi:hypothetical protein
LRIRLGGLGFDPVKAEVHVEPLAAEVDDELVVLLTEEAVLAADRFERDLHLFSRDMGLGF